MVLDSWEKKTKDCKVKRYKYTLSATGRAIYNLSILTLVIGGVDGENGYFGEDLGGVNAAESTQGSYLNESAISCLVSVVLMMDER